MRVILLIVYFIPFLTSAQSKIYNTHIDTAGTVNIYKGTVTINKLVITPNPTILLAYAKQTIDSDGLFTTIIALGHKENLPLHTTLFGDSYVKWKIIY